MRYVAVVGFFGGMLLAYLAGSNLPERDLAIAKLQTQYRDADRENKCYRLEAEALRKDYLCDLRVKNIENARYPRDFQKWESVKLAALKACGASK